MRYQYPTRPQDYTIYLDMDGVLTDFLRSVDRLVIQKIETFFDWEKVKDHGWKKVAEEGIHFWENMPWTRDGKRLYDYLKNHKDLRILSAYPQSSDNIQPALVGKCNWVSRELNIPFEKIHLVKGQDKQRYAERDAILIDDSARNIEQFKRMGGTGILHTTTANTMHQLRALGI